MFPGHSVKPILVKTMCSFRWGKKPSPSCAHALFCNQNKLTPVHRCIVVNEVHPRNHQPGRRMGQGSGWLYCWWNRKCWKATSQARNESSVAMMVKIQTIFQAILFNGIPKFTEKRKVAQNPLMPKDTCIARIEVQHQLTVSMWPTSVISAKIMVDDRLLSHASFNPCQRIGRAPQDLCNNTSLLRLLSQSCWSQQKALSLDVCLQNLVDQSVYTKYAAEQLSSQSSWQMSYHPGDHQDASGVKGNTPCCRGTWQEGYKNNAFWTNSIGWLVESNAQPKQADSQSFAASLPELAQQNLTKVQSHSPQVNKSSLQVKNASPSINANSALT